MPRVDAEVPITFFIDHLRAGGAQRWLILLAGELRAKGLDVHVVCLNGNVLPPVVNALRRADVHVEIIGKRYLLFGVGLARIAKILYSRRRGTVVSTLFFSDVLVAPLAKLAGVEKMVRAVRSRNLDYTRCHWFMQRLTRPLVDILVFVSRAAQSWNEMMTGAHHASSFIVYNMVPSCDDIRRIDWRSLLCERYGISKGGIIIGVLGRLEQEKNLNLILEGLQQAGLSEVTVLIAGQGSHLHRLKDLSARLRLQDRVQFIGFQEKPLEFLSGVDVMVSASRFEGQPNTLLEAIAVECPVILSDIPEHRETIEPLVGDLDVEPLFFQDNSAESLANRLAGLPHTLDGLRNISAQMRSQAAVFSAEKMVSSWMEILLGPEPL